MKLCLEVKIGQLHTGHPALQDKYDSQITVWWKFRLFVCCDRVLQIICSNYYSVTVPGDPIFSSHLQWLVFGDLLPLIDSPFHRQEECSVVQPQDLLDHEDVSLQVSMVTMKIHRIFALFLGLRQVVGPALPLNLRGCWRPIKNANYLFVFHLECLSCHQMQ